MALVATTLSSAVAKLDTSIVVASATSVAAGRLVQIDQEMMQVAQNYSSGTTVPVLRGRDGSVQAAHVVTARVVHGDAADFPVPAPPTSTTFPLIRAQQRISITATSSLTLPPGGEDLVVILNGTSVITLTIPVPTTDMDGCRLTIVPNGAAAHVLTFTGGLSGAGGGYTTFTVNATKPAAFEAIACNSVWTSIAAVPAAGTVTNITGTVA